MFDEISKLRFKNFKSFTDSDFEELDLTKPLILLMGKNNSGKSSILDLLNYVYLKDGSEEKYALHKMVESGTELHLGYVSHTERTNNILLSQNLKLAWYRAITYKEHLDSLLDYGDYWHPVDVDLKDKRLFKRRMETAHYNSSLLSSICFRRINADRDIVPEKEKDYLNVNADGTGTTNLIRRFINDASYKENFVEVTLLTELNKIMGPDAHFEKIRVQQLNEESSKKWEVYLKEEGQDRFALSQTGSGLKTIILMLVNLYLLPALPDNKGKHFVFAFEELENNLHPALQRRMFSYLCDYVKSRKNDVRIFLTTHSHVAINIFSKNENTSIYHVYKESGISSLRQIDSYYDKVDILEDLDVKASDILQANGIIWVEGPSDRIYIKRWLDVLSNNRFTEGLHYQFLYYGGRTLSHYELGGDSDVDEKQTADLINILTTNRHAVIVIDSDIRKPADSVNSTKQRVQAEFENRGFMCWITKGKEIENYLTANSINQAYGTQSDTTKLAKDIGQYQLFPNYIKKYEKDFSKGKVKFAKKVAPYITENDFRFDLKERIQELADNIAKWNKAEIN